MGTNNGNQSPFVVNQINLWLNMLLLLAEQSLSREVVDPAVNQPELRVINNCIINKLMTLEQLDSVQVDMKH